MAGMKRIIYLTILRLLLPILMPGILFGSERIASITSQEQAWLEAHPEITLGTDRGWRPYVMVEEDGTVSGIEADLIRRINKLTGANIRLITGEWSEIVEKAKAREIDGLALSAYHPERKAHFLFTDSTYRISKYIFTRAAKINTMEDLSGRRIGLRQGNRLEEKLLEGIPRITLVPVGSDEALVSLLQSRQVDAVIGGISLRLTAVEKMLTDIRLAFIVPDSETEILYSIRKDWPELQSIMNKALASVPFGERMAILEKWGRKYEAEPELLPLGLSAEEKQWLDSHPVIHLGGGILLPMDGMMIGGEVKGMARAYSDLIAGKLGIRFEHSAGVWADVHEQAKQLEIDGIRLVIPNQKRDAYLNFTAPYAESSFGVVTRDVATPPTRLDELTGKRVAVLKASYVHNYLAENHPDITLVFRKSFEAGIDAVFNGEADACIGALAMVDHIVRTKSVPGLRVTSLIHGIPSQPFTIGIREDWPEFVAILNKTIAAITPREHAAITREWMVLREAGDRIPKMELSEEEKAWIAQHQELGRLAFQIKSRVALSDAELEWLATNPKVPVRVGDYPPFHFVDDGKPQGLSIDYVKIICIAHNLDCDYVPGLTIAQSIVSMQKPEGIAIQPAWQRNAERERVATFTQSYVVSPFVIFQRQGGESILGMEDLVGKRVVVEKNYVIHKMLKRDYPELQLIEVDFSTEALKALADGRADAYVSSLMAGHYLSLTHGIPNIAVAAPAPFKPNRLEIAVRKDWPELASIIDKSLAAIMPEEHKIIRDRWLSVEYEQKIDYGLIWMIVLLAAAGFILFILWNVSLKRTVAQRTQELRLHGQMLENMTEGVYLVKMSDLTIAYANAKFEEIFGYAPDELLGQHVGIINAPTDQDPKEIAQIIEAELKRSGSWNGEVLNIKKNGEQFWCQVNISAFDHPQFGEVWLSIQQDITERKRNEEKIDQSTAELKKSESYYRSLFDNSLYAISMTGPDFKFQQVNTAFCQLLEYGEEELIGVMGIADVTHPDSVEESKKMVGKLISREIDHFVVEKRCVAKTGRVVDCISFVKGIYDEQGQYAGSNASILDITERKRIEEALYFSAEQGWAIKGEEFFPTLVTYLAESFGVEYALVDRLDNQGNAWTVALYAGNKIVENVEYSLKGTPCENVIGKKLCVYPQNICQLFPKDKLLIEMKAEGYIGLPLWGVKGEPIGLIALLDTKPLTEVELMASVLQVVAMRAAAELERKLNDEALASHRDHLEELVAERTEELHEAKEQAEAAKELYLKIFEDFPALIWRANLDKLCDYFNRTWLDFTGRTMEQEFGNGWAEGVHPDDFDRCLNIYTTAFDKREAFSMEYRMKHNSGEYRWIRDFGRPFFDLDNTFLGYIGVCYDITESKINQKRLEEQTAQLTITKEAAEAANQAKSIFLANMSHELRTPLNAILGFSGMMTRDHEATDTQKEKLSIINRSGEHLLEMIDDVLDLSKIEAGRVELEPVAFALPLMLADIGRMFEVRAEEAGLHFKLELDPDLLNHIKVDAGKLRQILINLLGNAAKFTYKGEFSLHAHTLPIVDDPTIFTLQLDVKDSGSGIPAEQLDHIFDPFIQVGQTPTTKGSGLGLAISKSFATLMGGRITVESTIGAGSLFRVELPVALAQATEVRDLKRSAPAVLRLAPGQPAWRILVVEDNPENRLLLCSLLTEAGFEVWEAENGKQAITLFEQWHPHFIWMDMRMPVMDGLEATRHIRTLPGGNEVKIAAITASAFKNQKDKVMTAGADDFVRKPFKPEDIFDCMARQLGVHYLYKQEEEKTEEHRVPPRITPEMLAGLPDDLIIELESAVRALDMEQTNAVLDRLDSADAELANALRRLVEEMDFGTLKRLLGLTKQQSGG